MKRTLNYIFFILLLSFISIKFACAQTTYTTTVVESKKNIHPRLFLDQVGIDQLKVQIATGKYKSLYDKLISVVNKYGSAPTTPVAIGTDLRFWGERLLNLSIAYKLSGNSTYLSRAESYATYLMTAPNTYYSDPELEPGHHLLGLAIFYDWCFEDMNSTVKSNLITFVNSKGNLLYTWLNNSSIADTKYYLSNQLYSRLSGLGTAALAFYECFDTKNWINLVMQKFIFADSVQGSDGAYAEGPGYGGYSQEYQMFFFDLSKTLLSYNFYDSTWWSNNSLYQIYTALPYSYWVYYSLLSFDIGDAPRYLWNGPNYLLRGIAKEKRDGYAQRQADMADEKNINNDKYDPVALNLFRYDPSVASIPLTNLPTLHYFDNYGVVTSRDSWENNKSVISFTCGPALGKQFVQNYAFDAGTGHSHPNANSFSIFSNGEFLIRNGGYIQRRTQYENTLLVDTKGQLDQAYTQTWWNSSKQFTDKLFPSMIKVESNSEFDLMVGDATKSYSDVSNYQRTLIYLKSQNIALVLDNIQSLANHNFELLFHAEQTKDSVVAINNTYKVKGDFTDLAINILTKTGVTIDFSDRSPTARDGVSVAYTNCTLDLKKTTNSWKNAISFSWSDKNQIPVNVSLQQQGSDLWTFNINGRFLTYNWANKTATFNTTELDNPTNSNSYISILSDSESKLIELIFDCEIKTGAIARLYSINGTCIGLTKIESKKTHINLNNIKSGIYLLQVINGSQVQTHKVII